MIAKGVEFAANTKSLVTLGMKHNRPETGYGYIKADDCKKDKCRVEAFKEKPNLATAKEYMANGTYFWNAGIFIWKANTVIAELQEQTPALAERFEGLNEFFFTTQEQEAIDREFPLCEKISIDYAVMEKSKRTFVFPASFGWSDLGTWGSLYTLMDKDDKGNATVSQEVELIDCEGCVVHTSQERKVVIQGLKDCIVAEHDNTLLICAKSEEQRIKEWI